MAQELKLCRLEIHGQERVGILEDKFVFGLTGSRLGIFSNMDTILAQAKEKNMSVRALIEKCVNDSLLMEILRSDE